MCVQCILCGGCVKLQLRLTSPLCPVRVPQVSGLDAAGVSASSAAPQLIRGVCGNVGLSRQVIRWWGTLEYVSALAHQVRDARKPCPDRVNWFIELLQNVSMLLYYPMDNVLHVHYTAPGVLPGDTIGTVERVGCGLWLLWAVLELWRLHRVRTAEEADGTLTSQNALNLWYQGVGTLADTVLALHWTVRGGVGLSEPVVGLLGTTAAVTGAVVKWRRMP